MLQFCPFEQPRQRGSNICTVIYAISVFYKKKYMKKKKERKEEERKNE